MAIENDIWFIDDAQLNSHQYPDGIGSDRVTFADLGIDVSANRNTVTRAMIRWWGGNFPDDPVREDRATVAKIASYKLEETPRSIADGLSVKEFILYPPFLTLEFCLTKISPERAS